MGQGRYVLAEKLCDYGPSGLANLPVPRQSYLPPPTRLLLPGAPGTDVAALAHPATYQLVPYEGLASTIQQHLPIDPESSFLPAVYDFSMSHAKQDPQVDENSWKYRFGERLGSGAFGEAWRAIALDGMREVVLKRLFVEKGEHVRASGMREIYFGTRFQNRPNIARFIESFEHQDAEKDASERPSELWLVFYNEGFSLTHHFFRSKPGESVLELSPFWWHLKEQAVGDQVIKNIVYQLLLGLKVAHAKNVTHRDIKLSNVFLTDSWPPAVRLGDWGSALVTPPPVDFLELYGEHGPNAGDETSGYQPPEVVFSNGLLERVGTPRAGQWRDVTYDLWSLGVMLLELILGTREVFQVEGGQRRWLKLEKKLQQHGVPSERFEEAKMLQAMLDFCIAPRGIPPGVTIEWFFTPGHTLPAATREAKERCTDEDFARILRKRDLASRGFQEAHGRDLLRRLLSWDPEDRILAKDALAHKWMKYGARLPRLHTVRPGREPIADDASDQQGPALTEAGADTEQNVAAIDATGALASGCSGIRLEMHAAAHDNIGRRRVMEDRHAVYNISTSRRDVGGASSSGFVGVYDGHNGGALAEELQRSLHKHLLARPEFPGNVSAALAGTFSEFEVTASSGGFGESGSTALVGVAAGCQLHLANLGDCRAVLARRDQSREASPWPLGAMVEVREAASAELRGQRGTIVEVRSAAKQIYVVRLLRDGALKAFRQGALSLLSELSAIRLTEDHKPDSPAERARIEALGGRVEEARGESGTARVAGLATSRAFGSQRAKPLVSSTPDISEVPLSPGKDVFVIFASDGVWDVLEEQFAVDLVWDQLSVHDVSQGPGPAVEEAAKVLVREAFERGSLDNLTGIVVLLTWIAGRDDAEQCSAEVTATA